MSCEKHQAALIDNAASSAELSGDLRAHVNACAACRDQLEQQRSLFAAIDSSVRATMNVPPPPALLQRFEARLAQQASLAPASIAEWRSPRLRWLSTAAVLATAAAVILLALPLRHAPKAKSRTAAATTSQTKDASVGQPPQIAAMILKPATPEEIRRDRKRRWAAAHPQPEVLVSPDERIALEHFLVVMDGREDLAAALATRVPQQQELRVAPLDMSDIQTAALTVPPIQDSAAVSNR